MHKFTTVSDCIVSQLQEHQKNLGKIREIIKKVAPDAVESISYGMPGYKYRGKPLVYFACAKKHIGLYPTPGPIVYFKKELAKYSTSKGAIQFPHHEEFPVSLIKKIIIYRKNFLDASQTKIESL